MNIKRNIDIPLRKHIKETHALARAKREFAQLDVECKYREVVTVYIHSERMSDLFIANRYRVRRCTDKEWGEYFHKQLFPITRDPFFVGKIKKHEQ